jgi:hypothetical protein
MSYSQTGSARSPWRLLFLCIAGWLLHTANALEMFESNSLNSCMKGSEFSASLFHVTFTPNNNTITFDINGFSQITANVILDVGVLAYGYIITVPPIDPCKGKDLLGLCPMNAAPIQIKGNVPIPADTVKKIPGMGILELPRFRVLY